MSVPVLSWVLNNSHAKTGARSVLVALADRADPEGRNCYESQDVVARKAGLTDRQVRSCLQALEIGGAIRHDGMSRLKTKNWTVLMTRVAAANTITSDVVKAPDGTVIWSRKTRTVPEESSTPAESSTQEESCDQPGRTRRSTRKSTPSNVSDSSDNTEDETQQQTKRDSHHIYVKESLEENTRETGLDSGLRTGGTPRRRRSQRKAEERLTPPLSVSVDTVARYGPGSAESFFASLRDEPTSDYLRDQDPDSRIERGKPGIRSVEDPYEALPGDSEVGSEPTERLSFRERQTLRRLRVSAERALQDEEYRGHGYTPGPAGASAPPEATEASADGNPGPSLGDTAGPVVFGEAADLEPESRTHDEEAVLRFSGSERPLTRLSLEERRRLGRLTEEEEMTQQEEPVAQWRQRMATRPSPFRNRRRPEGAPAPDHSASVDPSAGSTVSGQVERPDQQCASDEARETAQGTANVGGARYARDDR